MQINGTEIDFSKQRGYFFNMDCMEGMKEFPDKYFELAIVDPPYGLLDAGMQTGGEKGIMKTRAFHRASIEAWEKVRAEIEHLYEYTSREDYIHQEETRAFIDKSEVLDIIDKHIAEIRGE